MRKGEKMSKFQEILAKVVSKLENQLETDNILIGRIDALILLEACKKAGRYERKETPCKPVEIHPSFKNGFDCSVCKKQVIKYYKYCPECGQKLDWKI